MSHDDKLQKAVLAELSYEPTITAAHIGVTADHGTVTLTGHVESYGQKHAAEMAKADPAYSLEQALAAYRRQIVSGLYMTVAAASVMPDTPHNHRLLTTLARRNCAGVRDWDGLAALRSVQA